MDEGKGLTTPVGFGEALLLFCTLGGVALDILAIGQIDGAYEQSAMNDRSLLLHIGAAISFLGSLLMVPAVVVWRSPVLWVWCLRGLLAVSVVLFIVTATLSAHVESLRK
ncbi:hypothetical protein PLCT2_01005 [Planctomycetaceae bacterium]|nr:hypothetical protein PLCT2_01005 [Planctomycetaceae bacterium]